MAAKNTLSLTLGSLLLPASGPLHKLCLQHQSAPDPCSCYLLFILRVSSSIYPGTLTDFVDLRLLPDTSGEWITSQ